MQKEEVLQILRDHKQEFSERYHVSKVGIFGSVARNTASADSETWNRISFSKRN